MDREKMIDDVCNDLQAWLKRDPQSFWDHVEELERAYLKEKPDKELADIHEASV